MKVAVVAPEHAGGLTGGAERLYAGLVSAIAELGGHDVDLVTVVAPEFSFAELVESYAAFGDLDLSAYDHVISTKYPSWMVRHPSHSVYMLHPLRGLYDTYHLTGLPTESDSLEPVILALRSLLSCAPGTPGAWRRVLRAARRAVSHLGDDHPALQFPGPLCRALVHWLDRDALLQPGVRVHAAISRTVAHRIDYFPSGVQPLALPCPSGLRGLHAGPYEDALFTVSRLDAPKRLDLLIEAMAYVERPLRLRIAGTGPDEERLKSLAATDERIEFLGRLSDEELVDEYAKALAVPFIPEDEDLGLVTIEAHLAAKAVITCTDSGGVTDLVRHGVDGLISDPDPRRIAAAITALADDPSRAEEMGKSGQAAASEISWRPIVRSLLPPFPSAHRSVRQADRRKLIVLSTYPVEPATHGGQLRANRIVRGLSHSFDVHVVVLDSGSDRVLTASIGENITQTVVGPGHAYRACERSLAEGAPVPIGDVAAALFVAESNDFMATLAAAAENADLALLVQPYLLPALQRVAPGLPYIYDAQNAETPMKRAMYGESPKADRLSDVVRAVERAAVRGADVITYCSENDRQQLSALGPTQATWIHVPNGSDVGRIQFTTGAQRTANRERWLAALGRRAGRHGIDRLALFVGSYHKPNLEGADYLCDLAAEMPGVGFALVGGLGEYVKTRPHPRNVLVSGPAPAPMLRSLLASADVGLNPMFSGGGTNLKIIEYFAAGVPVVSTPLGARGIAAEQREHLILAEVEDFRRSVMETLEDPEAASRRATKARILAEVRYDWDVLARHIAFELAALEPSLIRSGAI